MAAFNCRSDGRHAVFGALRKVALKRLQGLHPKWIGCLDGRLPRGRAYLTLFERIRGFAPTSRRSFLLGRALRVRRHERVLIALARPSTRDALVASGLGFIALDPARADRSPDNRRLVSSSVQSQLISHRPGHTIATHASLGAKSGRKYTLTYRQVKHPVLLLGAHFFLRGCSGVTERLVADVLAGLENADDDVDATELMVRLSLDARAVSSWPRTGGRGREREIWCLYKG